MFQTYEEYQADLAMQEKHRPHCEKCGEPIWADEYFTSDDCWVLCESCFDEWLSDFKSDCRRIVDD